MKEIGSKLHVTHVIMFHLSKFVCWAQLFTSIKGCEKNNAYLHDFAFAGASAEPLTRADSLIDLGVTSGQLFCWSVVCTWLTRRTCYKSGLTPLPCTVRLFQRAIVVQCSAKLAWTRAIACPFDDARPEIRENATRVLEEAGEERVTEASPRSILGSCSAERKSGKWSCVPAIYPGEGLSRKQDVFRPPVLTTTITRLQCSCKRRPRRSSSCQWSRNKRFYIDEEAWELYRDKLVCVLQRACEIHLTVFLSSTRRRSAQSPCLKKRHASQKSHALYFGVCDAHQ